ncbi:hypothetical protein B0J12DRAFT_454318 [Macrophomina phaseolina]|uniref:Uncharacterized protein n=1 Tax=Macrophomina phaseolina TaxID=35725 RepID=A0ABQ8GFQ1_9PEZI|nr:hypothetical protein B0J12DRAFT_454318 [Macrophomina phaseolina]
MGATEGKKGVERHLAVTATEIAAPPDLQHFTATGRPKPSFDPSISNTDFGLFTGSGAPNLLPFRFTDDSIINVPVPAGYLEDETESSPSPTERKSSWIGKIGRKLGGKERQKFVNLKMTRGEYLKYWAKDENGNYIGTEPEGAGRQIWREKLKAEREASIVE